MSREWKIFSALVAIFVVAYTLPLENPKIQDAIQGRFVCYSGMRVTIRCPV